MRNKLVKLGNVFTSSLTPWGPIQIHHWSTPVGIRRSWFRSPGWSGSGPRTPGLRPACSTGRARSCRPPPPRRSPWRWSWCPPPGWSTAGGGCSRSPRWSAAPAPSRSSAAAAAAATAAAAQPASERAGPGRAQQQRAAPVRSPSSSPSLSLSLSLHLLARLDPLRE